jgi:DNA primase
MADPVIDEIKQRVDLVDLVSQTVELKRAGRHLKGLCPFHSERTPSFYVFPEQGTYHCFGCSKSGDVFTWLQETQHLDFSEALKQLAQRAGVTLPERRPAQVDPEAKAARDALSAAAAWFHDQLLHAPDAGAARQYLARRGITGETVERFQMGWAPDRWDALAQHLVKSGFTNAQLEEAGLARPGERGLIDQFRARVQFPIRDADGKVLGFGGRILGDATPGNPKYLNSRQTPFFDKSHVLFGLDVAKAGIRKDGCAVIVEGYMDVVVPHQFGFTNVVASLGTALTEHQIALLRRFTSTIVLALDADAAGQAATLRGLEVARQALATRSRPVPGPATRTGYLSLATGELKIAVLKGGKDPDEIVRDDPAAWRGLVAGAVPMMDHKMEVELARVDASDPRSKLAAVQEIARFLVLVPDRIEWEHYVDRLAQRLRLDIRAVREEVRQAERAARADQQRQDERSRERAKRGDGRPVAVAAARPSVEGDGAAPSGDEQGPPPGDEPAAAHAGRVLPVPLDQDATEEHLVSLLVLAPHLAGRLPARLTPEDFRRPECRELYRVILALAGGKQDRGVPDWPGAAWPQATAGAAAAADTDDRFRPLLDASLRDFYDALRTRARRRPVQTESQLEADLTGVTRRLRERNLRERLQEAQFLLAEVEAGGEERLALARQVEQLARQLNRVQIEQSRAALYTSPPS